MRPMVAEPGGYWVQLGSALEDLFFVSVNLYIVCESLLPPSVLTSRRITSLFLQREFLTVLPPRQLGIGGGPGS